ncbi:hypothetical protein ACIP4T_09025 [Streptomyces massasporeus]|uniref:hypothetical protein n=1 Tax=Streptomyces massasporeus TaxID=67324 RepID=UPI0036E291F7
MTRLHHGMTGSAPSGTVKEPYCGRARSGCSRWDSADGTKMLAGRARRKIRDARQPASTGRQQSEVVQAFLAAARDGRFEELLQVLHPDVKLTVSTPAGTFVTRGATDVATRG